MQQPLVRRDVYRPALAATIGSRSVDVESVSMDRDLPDPLTGGNLTAASGEFVTVEGDAVTSMVATPWDPSTQWPPVPETAVSVGMDTGSGAVQLLTGGRVISASGGTGSRAVSVEVADRYQSLDQTISWDALADAMPSEFEGQIARYVALRASAVTDRILRACGWYCTPPMIPYATFSVPAMGTAWPERGTCVSCAASSNGAYVSMLTEPWGVGVSDIIGNYRPSVLYTLKDRGRMELCAIAGRKNGQGMRLSSLTTGGREVRLAWTDAQASLWVTNSAGTAVSALSVPRNAGDLVYATLEYVTDTSVKCILRAGTQYAEATVSCHAGVTTEVANDIVISGLGVGAGFQVAFPSTSGSMAAWKPNAVIYDRAASPNSLRVLPPVAGANCADLMAQQCEAQNATYWIDETGVLRWWDMSRLEAQATAATLNSYDDIGEDGFTWSHDLSSRKSRVSVKWRDPLRQWSWKTNVDLWQGSGETLQSGDDPREDWLNVPDDEVWLLPDITPEQVGSTSSTAFNYGIGTWFGGVTDFSGADHWCQFDGTLGFTVQRVNDASFKLKTSWNGAKPVTQKTIDKDSAGSSDLWYRRYGMDLPIIRGKAKFTLADQITYSTQSGPTTAPEHVIEAGWWIQSAAQAQLVADYAGARVTVAQPVLSSIALVPLPGLQLGDMVEVRDTTVTRLIIRGIVVSDSRSLNSDMAMTHSVSVRPVYVTRDGVTWHEWADVARPKTRAQWAKNQDSTWAVWGSGPLIKEDVF